MEGDKISVKCERCGASFSVPSTLAGRKGKCACGNVVAVPRPEGAADPAPARGSAQWFYMSGGVQYGPVSEEDIKGRLASGSLAATDMVWTAALGSWKPANQVPALTGAETAAQTAKTEPAKDAGGWFYAEGGQARGPVTARQIAEIARTGRISAQTPVFAKGMAGWVALSTVPELASLLSAAPAPAAAPSQPQWFIASGGKTYGPYPEDTLRQMVQSGQVAADLMACTREGGTWRRIADTPELSGSAQPAAAAKQPPTQAGTEQQWYAVRSGEQIGPYTRPEMERLIKRGGLAEEDLVWAAAIGDWQPLKNVAGLAALIPPKPSLKDMSLPWYCAVGGQTSGPFNFDEIVRRVGAGELRPDDMVFSKQIGSWMAVSACDLLADALSRASAPAAAVEGSASPKPARTETAWFYMRAGQRTGPVAESELAGMLKAGSVSADTLVWRDKLPEWKAASQLEEFAPALAARAAAAAQPEPETRPDEPEPAKPAAAAAAPATKRNRRKVAVIGLVLALLALGGVGAVFGPGVLKKGARPPAEAPQPEAQKQTPTVASAEQVEKAAILNFLREFVSGDEKRRTAAVRANCLKGWLDVYSDDIVSRAAFLLQSRAPVIDELPTTLLRASSEKSFCYHAATDENVIEVTVIDERDSEQVLRFLRKDFAPVRCLVLHWPGEALMNQLRVLVQGKGAEMRILSFGRTGFVGAAAGGRQIDYMTGFLQVEMAETQSKIFVHAGPAPEGAKDDWESFGVAMSADPRVMAAPYKREYSRILGEQHSFFNDWILLYASRSISDFSIADVERVYGKPEKQKSTRMLSGEFTVRTLGGALTVNDETVNVRYYGALGLVSKPDNEEIVGVLLRLPKRDEE